jgi:hypothetical protein
MIHVCVASGKNKENVVIKILDCFKNRSEYKININIQEIVRKKSSYITRRIETPH